MHHESIARPPSWPIPRDAPVPLGVLPEGNLLCALRLGWYRGQELVARLRTHAGRDEGNKHRRMSAGWGVSPQYKIPSQESSLHCPSPIVTACEYVVVVQRTNAEVHTPKKPVRRGLL